ncbi:transposase [Paenibacillus larvae]|nr:transposase [Paenibacillus larvae]MDT2236033.1 transposase [Paenibacillus larvae]
MYTIHPLGNDFRLTSHWAKRIASNITECILLRRVKRIAVEDYLAGGGSHMDICKRYGIKSTCQLRDWILKYNGHEEVEHFRNGRSADHDKGRTTTYDERVEIVRFCIEHQHNYAQTADKFQVSYPSLECIHGQINT